MKIRIYNRLLQKKTKTQAKYQNGISYHLLLCFLAVNPAVRFISSFPDDFTWLLILTIQLS